jgi:hypothetical protein
MKEIVDERDDLLKANQILQALIGNRDKEVDRLRLNHKDVVETKRRTDERLKIAIKALQDISAMDPDGIRADDLGRAARLAAEGIKAVVGSAPGSTAPDASIPARSPRG